MTNKHDLICILAIIKYLNYMTKTLLRPIQKKKKTILGKLGIYIILYEIPKRVKRRFFVVRHFLISKGRKLYS